MNQRPDLLVSARLPIEVVQTRRSFFLERQQWQMRIIIATTSANKSRQQVLRSTIDLPRGDRAVSHTVLPALLPL